MMGDFTPIETVYAGCRFRSRLEARWAVFFDALGEKWEYEKEGFDLPFGGPYLPDFWLPYQQCWVEVKGVNPTKEEDTKAAALAWATDHWVDVLIGPVGEHRIQGWRMPYGGRERLIALGLCARCDRLVFLRPHAIHMRDYIATRKGYEHAEWDEPIWSGRCYGCGSFTNERGGTITTAPPVAQRLYDALQAGRSARFEHGESAASRAPISKPAPSTSRGAENYIRTKTVKPEGQN